MIAELIYTSAAKTLDGSGYGVVAKSANLPERLETFLRELSRYDFALPGPADSTVPGPIVFSHAKFSEHIATWHVLSRVAPGGYDYSQRAVYLAHHVALAGDELHVANVIDLIRAPSMFVSQWDGHVGLLPARQLPALAQVRTARTTSELGPGHLAWLKAWGDARDHRDGGASFLIVPRNADVLDLFAEALSLYSPRFAADVAFITHMNADRPGVHFDWMGVVAGSELARSIAQRFPDRTLDLTKPYTGTVPAPARKEHAAVAATRPKKHSAALGPPVTPARHDQDFDAIWFDEIRPRPDRDLPDEPAPQKLAPPPPPPLPPSAFSMTGAPIIALAVLLTATIVALAAWQFRNVISGPKVATGQPAGGEAVPGKETNPDGGEAVPGKETNPAVPEPGPASVGGGIAQNKDRPGDGGDFVGPPRSGAGPAPGAKSPNGPNHLIGSEPGDPLPPIKIYHLSHWLLPADDDGDAENPDPKWAPVPVEDGVDTQINGIDKPTLKLLPCTGLALSWTPFSDDQYGSGIDAYRGLPSAKRRIALRVKNHKLELKGLSVANEALIGALELSILQIDTGIPNDPPLLIAFTPEKMPAIPLGESKNKDAPVQSAFGKAVTTAGARRFFRAIDRESQYADVRVRVGRVTLAIGDPGDAGWPLEQKREDRIGNAFKLEPTFLVRWHPAGTWSAPIRVGVNVDREQTEGLRAISADLISPTPVPQAKKLEPASESRQEATHTQTAPRSRTSGKRNDSTKVKKQGAEPAPAGAARSPEGKTQESPSYVGKEQELLHAVFERFGLVHGSIVIRVNYGTTPDEPVDLLQFGEPRELARPFDGVSTTMNTESEAFDPREFLEQFRQSLQVKTPETEAEMPRSLSIYSQLCEEANRRLRECFALIQRGQYSDAVQLAEREPNLLDRCALLEIPERDMLVPGAKLIGAKPPVVVNRDLVAAVQDSYQKDTTAAGNRNVLHRLTLAQAPLPTRLTVMRRLLAQNPNHPFMEADIRTFERAWFKQAVRFAQSLVKEGRPQWIAEIRDDLEHAGYLESPPSALISQLRSVAAKVEAAQLPALAEQIRQAFAQRSVETMEQLEERWKSLMARVGPAGADADASSGVADAFHWLAQSREQSRKGDEQNAAHDRLEQAIEAPASTKIDLESAFRTAKAAGMVDGRLDQQFRSRMAAIDGSRRTLVMGVAIAVGVALVSTIIGVAWAMWPSGTRSETNRGDLAPPGAGNNKLKSDLPTTTAGSPEDRPTRKKSSQKAGSSDELATRLAEFRKQMEGAPGTTGAFQSLAKFLHEVGEVSPDQEQALRQARQGRAAHVAQDARGATGVRDRCVHDSPAQRRRLERPAPLRRADCCRRLCGEAAQP